MNMGKMIKEIDIDNNRQNLYIKIMAHQIDHSPCKIELRTLLFLLCEPGLDKSDDLRQELEIRLGKCTIGSDEP